MKKFIFLILPAMMLFSTGKGQDRKRVRELGIEPGILTPGRLNAITDVEGVAVGQKTLSSAVPYSRNQNIRQFSKCKSRIFAIASRKPLKENI